MASTSLRDRLLVLIAQRYRAHAARDLADYMFAQHLFHTVDPELSNFAHAHHQDISDYLAQRPHVDELVDYCIRATKRYTYQRNQFINYTNDYDRLLQAEYRDLFAQIQRLVSRSTTRDAMAQALAIVVQRHHERLRLILASYCVSYRADDLAEHPLLQTVPCEEYAAPFQLRVLGLDLAHVREPILDIGCGAGGSLVRFLRQQGYNALGVDRLAPAAPYFVQSDWFDFDYTQQTWGTVVAHHALSTHFIYNYLQRSATTRQYEQLFRKILANIAPDGSFWYAPGLPFFEDQINTLPQYTLTKTSIATNEVLGIGEIAYATRITRRMR